MKRHRHLLVIDPQIDSFDLHMAGADARLATGADALGLAIGRAR